MSNEKKTAVRKTANPWTLKVLDILQDGEWHNFDEIVSECMPLVPPGVAWRKAEKNRQQHYDRQGRPQQDRHYGDKNTTIQTGQRMLVAIGVRGLARHGRIEVEYQDPSLKRKRPSRVRLTP